MKKHKIYVGGSFCQTDEAFDVRNPYNEEVVSTTYRAGEREFEVAVCAAENVREEMACLPSYKKYEILRFVSDALISNRVKLAKILAAESGKPLVYALGEVGRAAQTFLIAGEEAKRLPGEEFMRLDWTKNAEGKKAVVRQFPVGLIAGISPFNFPLNLVAHKIAPAIAAGCPIVLKPASATPLSALELAKILDDTDLPKGAVSILPMDRSTGSKLVTDERFSLLSFTGSPHIGWKMKSKSGKKKVVLELGGNAAAIVTESADLERILPRCVVGAFAYSGQVCIHTQRFYVHESKFDEFVLLMKEAVKKLKIGPPTNECTDFSSMIDEKNALRMEEWLAEAVRGGAKVLAGGQRNGAYYPPTILTNVKKSDKVYCEEVFGPIILIEKYCDFFDAVSAVNDSKFGLQVGVFSSDHEEINNAFEKLEVGGVIVNDVPTFRVDHMPYGGVKDSGLGREGVKYSMLDMLEPRIMVY